ncbi:MAG: transposase [Zoogloeaceae bacterium]|jgi:type I restriction enzyme R subunit/putative DNA methylase|nr:transposase [Zoogloeaceae bacterium]
MNSKTPPPWERQAPAWQKAPKEADAKLELGAPGVPGTPGWYSRGYLPHRDEFGLLQSITFRLADSLPQEKLHQLEKELAALPEEKRNIQRRIEIEKWLDAGMGCCALRHPALAAVLENALLHADGSRYRLLAWCIMPNHVHVLILQKESLAKIVQSWKAFSGRWAMANNAKLGLGVSGKPFWMREVWDRFIRDEKHLRATIDYIHENPVKARLCQSAGDWLWSSASENHRERRELRERQAPAWHEAVKEADAKLELGAPSAPGWH